jgi:hypothetical protein
MVRLAVVSFGAGVLVAVAAVAGATASGFTGLAYAEWARLGGAKRTEATGLGSGIMFAGVMIMPSIFSVTVTFFDDYGIAYGCVGGLALLSGLLLFAARRSR